LQQPNIIKRTTPPLILNPQLLITPHHQKQKYLLLQFPNFHQHPHQNHHNPLSHYYSFNH
ncbi:replication/maintenance protein RepL, partial [Staphylococcus warneri]|uniref:replication/maintenance protein RepL n=1 Tax=Staphylococcus warneri TaxID=1292 RepID=UPI00164356F0